MKNMNAKLIVIITVMAALLVAGCDALDFSPESKIYDGPSLAKFTDAQVTFTVAEDLEFGTIQVSVLKAPSSNVTYTVSPSDIPGNTAELGVHYNFVNGNTITIPAGELFGELEIEIVTTALTCDTRLFLELEGANVASYNNEIDVRFVIFTPFDINAFPGLYNVTYPWWIGSDDPYEITVSMDGEVENRLIFENFLQEDNETNNLIVNFTPDENQSDFSYVMPQQPAGWTHPAGEVWITGSGAAVYDFCSIELELSYLQHFIPGVGSFAANPATLIKVD